MPVATDEGEIAVVTGVRRVDRTRHAVMRAAGQQVALDLRAPGVGGDDHQRRVGPGARRILLEGRGVGEARRVGRRARPDEQAPVVAHDVADRVHHRDRTDHHVAVTRRRAAEAAGGAVLGTPPLRHPSPAAGADAPGREDGGGILRRGERGAALLGPRAQAAGRDEVEDRRGRHDGHRPAQRREAAALLGERLHHAVGGGEPERRPAGEHDRVDVLDGGERVEHRGLARRGRAAADLDRADGLRWQQHDGHAGVVAGPVPGLHPRDVGDHVNRPRRRSSRRAGRRRRPGARARTP